MGYPGQGVGPAVRAAAARALAVAGVLVAVFAWGLWQVVVEARTYATVHGLPADTSDDQAVVVVCAVLATGLLAVSALPSAAGWLRRSRPDARPAPRG